VGHVGKGSSFSPMGSSTVYYILLEKAYNPGLLLGLLGIMIGYCVSFTTCMVLIAVNVVVINSILCNKKILKVLNEYLVF
jgi:hypothetical protein